MRLSAFGQKFSAESGVVDLMQDLGEALHDNPDMLFMGGGNPARIPAADDCYRRHLRDLAADPAAWPRLAGSYGSPDGDRPLRQSLARYFSKHYGWRIDENNIALSNGSQSACFLLYNLFAGPMADGSSRRIHLPLSPEYIGYADTGLSEDFFSASKPRIERRDEHAFKYRLDMSALPGDGSVGALCLSRPTNPSGNIATAEELAQLDGFARTQDVPLIVDGAYGPPFPDITYTECPLDWGESTILTLSLSKLGMPGLRTGIVIAREDIVAAFNRANTIISLATGSVGPTLAERLLRSGDLERLTREEIRPYYRRCMLDARAAAERALGDLPWRLHEAEGGFFLWCWFEGLPISSAELYRRLKQAGVLAIPGERFFIGLDPAWQHSRECLRLSFAQDSGIVRAGLEILAREVGRAYAGN
jgi:valine--pyruvate aminotransferase